MSSQGLVDYLTDGNPWLDGIVETIVIHGPFDDRMQSDGVEALVALDTNYIFAYRQLQEHFPSHESFQERLYCYRDIVLRQHRKDTRGAARGFVLKGLGFERDSVEKVFVNLFKNLSQIYRLLAWRVEDATEYRVEGHILHGFEHKKEHERWLRTAQRLFFHITKDFKYIANQYHQVWGLRFNGTDARASINGVLQQMHLPKDPAYEGLSESLTELYGKFFYTDACEESPAVIGCLERRLIDTLYTTGTSS